MLYGLMTYAMNTGLVMRYIRLWKTVFCEGTVECGAMKSAEGQP